MPYRRILALAVLTVFFCCFIALAVAPKRHISGVDGFDYLQMAMNFANGDGFVSSRVYLDHAYWFTQHGFKLHGASVVPMLYRFPLPVLIEASFMRLGFSPYTSAQMYSTLGCLLSGILLFLIVMRFSNSLGATMALTLAFFVAESSVGYAVSGLTEPMATLFFLLLLVVMVSPISQYWRSLLGGLLTGLAYLNRTPSIFLMLPTMFIGLLLIQEKGIRSWGRTILILTLAVGVLFLSVSPWLYHNYALSGNFFFNFTNRANLLNELQAPLPPSRYYSMSTTQFLTAYYPFIFQKFMRNLASGILNLRILLNVNKLMLLPFLLGTGLCLLRRNTSITNLLDVQWLRRLSILWWSACFFNVVGHSLAWDQRARFYAPVWPMILVLGFTGILFAMNVLRSKLRYSRDRISINTMKLLAGVVTGFLYVALNPPILHYVDLPGSQPWETVKAVGQTRSILCNSKDIGAVVSDVAYVFGIELHGCNRLMADIGPLTEWEQIVNVSAVFLSRKTVEEMTLKSATDLAVIERRYPHIITMGDGSRLYLKQ